MSKSKLKTFDVTWTWTMSKTVRVKAVDESEAEDKVNLMSLRKLKKNAFVPDSFMIDSSEEIK